MKLSDALQGFFIDRRASGYSPATIRTYNGCLTLFKDYLQDPTLRKVTKQDLLNFFHFLRTEYKPRRFSGSEEPLSPASLDNYWIALRSFFKWCHEELDIENISISLPRPKYEPPEIEPLTRKDIQEILKAATIVYVKDTGTRRGYTSKAVYADRNRALILLMLDTGIRLGELCHLKIEDVDLENGMITIKPYQSSRKSRPRQIPLGVVARKAVWRYVTKIDPLWPDDPLFDLTKRGVQSLLYRIKKKVGNDKIHAHRFRHTFAVEYLRNGGDIFTLQYFLGHSSLEMVKRYLYYATDDRREMHRRASPADRWLSRKI